MMRARVAFSGAIHTATPGRKPNGLQDPVEGLHDPTEELLLDDGRLVSGAEVVWLPPFEVGTIIALGLNYADHAKELKFNSQEEPLVFLKGPGSLLGHRGTTRRPAGVKFMHYECELAVIIGRRAKNVSRAAAMRHVAGDCIANDYAIRDYLQNWYRPHLRVKNRDGGTVLGPWFVDASDVPDPANLALRTHLNGGLKQQGNPPDLIFDLPCLFEHLTSSLPLSPPHATLPA